MDNELLKILVCPRCRESLEYRSDQSRLECARCHVFYPIEDGIPILLPDRAIAMQDEPQQGE